MQGPGKRILTFVVGGISRSELRVAHALAARTGRDITIGSTSIETPASFLQRVQVRHTALPAVVALSNRCSPCELPCWCCRRSLQCIALVVVTALVGMRQWLTKHSDATGHLLQTSTKLCI